METLRMHAVVGEDRKLTITLPAGIPSGPVDIVLLVSPSPSQAPPRSLAGYYGIGRDLQTAQDPQEHVNELRDEWER